MTFFQNQSSLTAAGVALTAMLFVSAGRDGAAAPVSASTLSPPRTPELKPEADGFLRRWLVLEPIASNGLTDSIVQAAVKKEPFLSQVAAVPRDEDKLTVDGTNLVWHAVDTTKYNLNLFHFATALKKNTSNVLFWVVTVVNAPREVRDVRLAIGSNAASVWWVNGQEVTSIYGDRQTVIDDGVSKRLTLKKGPNVIRGAVVNGGGATDFCARILEANDKPVSDVTVNLNLNPGRP
jgi:hypothetical protein